MPVPRGLQLRPVRYPALPGDQGAVVCAIEHADRDAAAKALSIVQSRVEDADLTGLFDRVTWVATERTMEAVSLGLGSC